jgi:hypothetical protein
MSKTVLLSAFGVVAIVGAIGLGYILSSRKTMAPNQKLHDYCSAVHIALAMDAKDLEARKTEAAARFGEQVTFHSEYEIALCAKTPVSLEKRPMCAIEPNYECLAKLARAAADATTP